MGKNIPLQRRGKGSVAYRVPSHRSLGDATLYPLAQQGKATIEDIVHSPFHTAPIAILKFEGSKRYMVQAAEGSHVGQVLSDEPANGNVLRIENIPEGSMIFNIELSPGDGGKLVRSGGTYARLVSKEAGKAVLRLPSGQFKTIQAACRAIIGVAAGGGKQEKPWVKAGKKFHAMRVKNRLWPKVKGNAKNPVDHPFGGGKKGKVGRPITVSRNAPAGAKVGYIAARRTGRRR